MTTAKIIEEIKGLSAKDRTFVVEEAIRHSTPETRKSIERLLRRLQHPEVPESFWQGVEDHEDDRTVEMDTALRETPPGR